MTTFSNTLAIKTGSTAATLSMTAGSDLAFTETARSGTKRQFFVFTDAQTARRRFSLDSRLATSSVNKTTGAIKYGKNDYYLVQQDLLAGTNAVVEAQTFNLTISLSVGLTDAQIKDQYYRFLQIVNQPAFLDMLLTQNIG